MCGVTMNMKYHMIFDIFSDTVMVHVVLTLQISFFVTAWERMTI